MSLLEKKIRIGGVKLSFKLVLGEIPEQQGVESRLPDLCRILANNQININFLAYSGRGDEGKISFCVGLADEVRVRELISARFVSSIGLVSLFPTGASHGFLGQALGALGGARIPVYALASSASTLTFVTDFKLQDKAVAALLNRFELPPGVTPGRPEILVSQSSIIKKD